MMNKQMKIIMILLLHVATIVCVSSRNLKVIGCACYYELKNEKQDLRSILWFLRKINDSQKCIVDTFPGNACLYFRRSEMLEIHQYVYNILSRLGWEHTFDHLRESFWGLGFATCDPLKGAERFPLVFTSVGTLSDDEGCCTGADGTVGGKDHPGGYVCWTWNLPIRCVLHVSCSELLAVLFTTGGLCLGASPTCWPVVRCRAPRFLKASSIARIALT